MYFVALFVIAVILFAFAPQGVQAPDLADQLGDRTSRAYSTLATAYPAYIAALLLPHRRAGLSSTNRTVRATSSFLIVGFGLAIVRFGLGLVTLILPPAYFVGQAVTGLAAVFVALGLATEFFSRIRRRSKAPTAIL